VQRSLELTVPPGKKGGAAAAPAPKLLIRQLMVREGPTPSQQLCGERAGVATAVPGPPEVSCQLARRQRLRRAICGRLLWLVFLAACRTHAQALGCLPTHNTACCRVLQRLRGAGVMGPAHLLLHEWVCRGIPVNVAACTCALHPFAARCKLPPARHGYTAAGGRCAISCLNGRAVSSQPGHSRFRGRVPLQLAYTAACLGMKRGACSGAPKASAPSAPHAATWQRARQRQSASVGACSVMT
jgi:hypothetical protein